MWFLALAEWQLKVKFALRHTVNIILACLGNFWTRINDEVLTKVSLFIFRVHWLVILGTVVYCWLVVCWLVK